MPADGFTPMLGPEPQQIIALRDALAEWTDTPESVGPLTARLVDAAVDVLAEWDRGRAATALAMREAMRTTISEHALRNLREFPGLGKDDQP
ncbi:hypothetical protein PBI_THONKO_72 [Mycobacterium phage Thonko]|uniref:Uncharacterized protein n=1 Tax=Mycobacterium phage Thonko TaxID=2282910 RepID=A0A346FCB8_9CAUD|nr:hypothetical protein I5G57_gp072 [Mycobacterium phage Thonko]AXN53343.1 hypothetical protein PBI_THONKO_72 [Mycobacterium phage Thonko]